MDIQGLLFSDECLFTLDDSFQIRNMNPTAARLFEFEVSAFGKTAPTAPPLFFKFIDASEKERVQALFHAFKTSGAPLEFEATALSHEQKSMPFRWRLTKLPTGFVGGSMGLLGRPQSLGKISRSIAHDLNNPLAVIHARSFQLEQFSEGHPFEPIKLKEIAQGIGRAAEKIQGIIKALR